MRLCSVTVAAALWPPQPLSRPVTALAEDKLVLKASDVHPQGYPTVQAVEDMGKKLSAATNGRLSIQMYPSMQLGGEKEAIEQAQVGAIAFARVRSVRSARLSTISTSSTCLTCSATRRIWRR